MNGLRQILNREKDEEILIYLYKTDKFWFACERSAFYLFSICSVRSVYKLVYPQTNDVLLISLLEESFDNISNSKFEVLNKSENQMILKSNAICKGFSFWKQEFDLYQDLAYSSSFNDVFQSINTQ